MVRRARNAAATTSSVSSKSMAGSSFFITLKSQRSQLLRSGQQGDFLFAANALSSFLTSGVWKLGSLFPFLHPDLCFIPCWILLERRACFILDCIDCFPGSPKSCRFRRTHLAAPSRSSLWRSLKLWGSHTEYSLLIFSSTVRLCLQHTEGAI